MSSTKYTLDRFEGDFAVFLQRPEEDQQLLIPRLDIDIEVTQGDIVAITKQEDGSYHLVKDSAEIAAAKERIKALRARLNLRKQ